MAEHGLTLTTHRTVGLGKVLILLILFCLLTVAVANLTTALRGPNLIALWSSLLTGLLLAWGLAHLHRSILKSMLILFLTGALFLSLVPGELAIKLGLLSLGTIRWMLGLIPFYHATKVDSSQLAFLLIDLHNTASVLFERSLSWMKALAAGKPAFDPLAATLVWNGAVWIIASWSGWALEMYGNALLAVLPALLLSLETLSSGSRMTPGLYVLLGLTLLLLAVQMQDRRKSSWNVNGAAFPVHKGEEIIRSALLLTIPVVLLSVGLSGFSTERFRHWIDQLRQPAPPQKSGLAQSLGIVPEGTVPPDIFKAVRDPGLPREHLIGSGPELSGRVVMTIKVADLAAISQAGQPLPLYWRGFTYDVYTGQGWSSSETVSSATAANAPIQKDHASGHLLIREDLSPVENLGGTLFAAGEPVKLNIPSEIAWRGTGDLFGMQSNIASAYEVRSLIPVEEKQVLQQAGETYPDWVIQRFLSLPAELPQRVKSLALQITASTITPYDRAVAIENYLRNYPYTLNVPLPPLQRDVTDYFLFDLKKGYCDYFATAMVVLARAAGVPARLAIGYAPGTYNLNSKRFIVTEADAHSWAELYFPGIGWVPFEATPSRPVLDRNQSIPIETTLPPDFPSQTVGPTRNNQIPWSRLPFALLALLSLLGIGLIFLDGYRMSRLSRSQLALNIYKRLNAHALRLNVHTEPGYTPSEFSTAFQSRINEIKILGVWTFINTDLPGNIQEILNEIIFSSYQASPSSEINLIAEWQKLRWQLWLIWVRSLIGWRGSGESSHLGQFVR